MAWPTVWPGAGSIVIDEDISYGSGDDPSLAGLDDGADALVEHVGLKLLLWRLDALSHRRYSSLAKR